MFFAQESLDFKLMARINGINRRVCFDRYYWKHFTRITPLSSFLNLSFYLGFKAIKTGLVFKWIDQIKTEKKIHIKKQNILSMYLCIKIKRLYTTHVKQLKRNCLHLQHQNQNHRLNCIVFWKWFTGKMPIIGVIDFNQRNGLFAYWNAFTELLCLTVTVRIV